MKTSNYTYNIDMSYLDMKFPDVSSVQENTAIIIEYQVCKRPSNHGYDSLYAATLSLAGIVIMSVRKTNESD